MLLPMLGLQKLEQASFSLLFMCYSQILVQIQKDDNILRSGFNSN